jgi:hypothetical protein
MLITSPEFTSNITGKSYYTKSFDPLDCSTKNVIYGIECTLCGLLYVGETRQTLQIGWVNIDTGICIIISINRVITAVWRWKFESSRRFIIIQTVLCLVHLTVPIESCFGLNS